MRTQILAQIWLTKYCNQICFSPLWSRRWNQMSTQVKLKHSFTPSKDMECKVMLRRTQWILIQDSPVIWSKSLKLCLVSSKKLSLWKDWRRLWGFCGRDGLLLLLQFDTRSSRRWTGWSFWLYWKGLRATFLGIRLLLDLGFCLTLRGASPGWGFWLYWETGEGTGSSASSPPASTPTHAPHTPAGPTLTLKICRY